MTEDGRGRTAGSYFEREDVANPALRSMDQLSATSYPHTPLVPHVDTSMPPPPQPHGPTSPNARGVELLIHNLSHSDLVLGLNNAHGSLRPLEAIARPKFSNFRAVTKEILRVLENSASIEALGGPRVTSRSDGGCLAPSLLPSPSLLPKLSV